MRIEKVRASEAKEVGRSGYSRLSADALACLSPLLHIEIIDGREAMEAVRPEWSALFADAAFQSFYCEPDYCLNWIEHYGMITVEGRSLPPARPVLLLGRATPGGRLDLVLPLRAVPSSRSLPGLTLWSLEGLVNIHSDESALLVRRECEAAAARAVERLIRASRWHRVALGSFVAGSATADVLSRVRVPRTRCYRRRERDLLWLSLEGSFAEFLAARPRLRKHIVRARKRLERDFGPVSLECITGDDAIEQGFPLFVDVDARSWKAHKAGGEALVNAPRSRAFFEGLTRRFAADGRAHVWVMRLDGIPAAAELTYASHGRLYSFKTSFDRQFGARAGQRPGFLLHALIMEQIWDRFESYDFMGGWFHEEWDCLSYGMKSEELVSLDPIRFLTAFGGPGFPAAPQ